MSITASQLKEIRQEFALRNIGRDVSNNDAIALFEARWWAGACLSS